MSRSPPIERAITAAEQAYRFTPNSYTYSALAAAHRLTADEDEAAWIEQILVWNSA